MSLCVQLHECMYMLDGTREGCLRLKPQQGVKSFWLPETRSLLERGVFRVKMREVPGEVKQWCALLHLHCSLNFWPI